MASGKRASMREGPLASLFSRTDGETEEPEGAGEPEVAFERPSPERPIPEQELRPAPPSARRAQPSPPVSEIRVRRAEPSDHDEDSPRRPRSAEERLRAVFSADVPEDILQRPPAPQQPRFGRAEPKPLPAPEIAGSPVLRVAGVGGAGVNALNRMMEAGVEGVEFLALNTDTQSLQTSSAHVALDIGSDLTRGLGSGSSPELGRDAALEDADRIKGALKGSDLVFVTAGAGGGTGTGAAPVVARLAREVGALVVGVVTKPFSFEGTRRAVQAEEGIRTLAEEVDTLIVIPNSRLLSVLEKGTSIVDAFRVADDVLRQGVQGISDLVTLPGLINLDFADVRTIMSQAGPALLGIGMGVGERRAMDAAERAVASPLLETSIEGAHSILLSITGGRDMSLWEVNEAARAVSEAAHPDANIIFGAMVDENVVDQVWVTVVATRYGDMPRHAAEPASEPSSAEPVLAGVGASNGAGPDSSSGYERAGEERSLGPPPSSSAPTESLGELEVPEFVPRSGRR
ncbi:MAG: Cell division protein FtsZ [uncultured Solirubrobacterales bacterium]|uniref:Cell division protein FtsZ n=1 Tax=uncultured Solirubrobacterales bacterium TaxID=768556 RepID=A0A6J4SHH7_9ACTN|nr:MAG: Cell division protein FtsZ [uncultured Solirubrobacterales bacterium]